MTAPRYSPGTVQRLMALAERCEKARAPDRDLDYDICEAVNPWLAEQGYTRWQGDYGWYSETPVIVGANKVAPASDYTASIDAAMALGEAGAEISISTLYGVARVEYPLNFSDHQPYYGEHVGGLIAPAICAAMLRARAAKLEMAT